MKRRNFIKMSAAAGIALAMHKNVFAQTPPPPDGMDLPYPLQHKVTPADRRAAAKRLKELGLKPGVAAANGIQPAAIDPRDATIPHYFGPYANYAYSPLPKGPITSIVVEDGGSGYTMPFVSIHDVYGTGSGATFSVELDTNGKITAIKVANGGTNYRAPLVVIEDTNPDPLQKGSGAVATASIAGKVVGGIRKFVDSLVGLTPAGKNTQSQYIPIAVSEEYTSPIDNSKSDYYEIALVEYKHTFHVDLPPTTVRGYVQLETANVKADPAEYPLGAPVLTYPDGTPIEDANGNQVTAVSEPHYLGPLIVAERNRPLRVKFTNYLPTGTGGDLFIPVDKTVMGAGMGPIPMLMPDGSVMKNPDGTDMMEDYTQNRATVHMHGMLTPWISDGTPHQWVTPAGENTMYPKGVSVQNVPDMSDPGPGSLTFYYNNQQSARLMFYHDHSYGITRLNVYAGEAAPYVLTDLVEKDLTGTTNDTGVKPLANATDIILPDLTGIPLVIQDKTFVDADTIAAQDPTWKWGLDPVTHMPTTGSLWLPSVYMPAQNPWDPSGASAYGRWQYGPWFWPPTSGITFGPMDNVYYQPNPALPFYSVSEPPMQPSMPTPSMGMEAYNDTPLVNGTAYPYMEVQPRAYRFRILNAANDRFFNLQFYIADPETVAWQTPSGGVPVEVRNTEVKMVPAVSTPGFPANWSKDGREGGVPDPATRGPDWIQIGTEGGFLPAPVVIPPQPVNWNMNATAFNVGNVTDHSLLLGCAERADVIVDFSGYAGQTLILYNDAPAAFPALDPRYDYYTGSVDQTETGGAPTTQPGYGPNTRTIMQFRVMSDGGTVGTSVESITVLNGGSDYQKAPEVVLSGGLGTGASAVATCSIDHVTILTTGSGYTTPPAVTFTPAGATGEAILTNGRVTSIKITNKGAGYTDAPVVSFDPNMGSTTAVAALTVNAVTLVPGSAGSGYQTAPQVSFFGGGGYGAMAVAKLLKVTGSSYNLPLLEEVFARNGTKPGVFETSQEPILIPQAAYNSAYGLQIPDDTSGYVLQHDFSKTFFNGPLKGINLLKSGTGYTSAPTVDIFGGGGSDAAVNALITGAYVNGITLNNRGSGYTSTPLVTISGGTGTGATAIASITRVVSSIAVTNQGSGYTSAPTVRFTGGGSGATATAVISAGRVTSITVTNGGVGYFFAPTISFSGGGGTGARATATITGVVSNITITNTGNGYAPSPLPTVSIAGPSVIGGVTATATASVLPGTVTGFDIINAGINYTSKPTLSITGGGGSGATAEAIGITLGLEPKAIHDEMGAAYDIDYGRMGGLLGLELPVVNSLNQNMVLLGFSSPPVDLMRNSMAALGTLEDGTQIWKITQNGVDTHPMHFHLVNVQVINRVAWDGALLPPEPNELGWKETVRTNPLEHLIVAMRPVAPMQPFDVPNSIRLIDPTMPVNAELKGGPQGYLDPTGQAVTANAFIRNHEVNFGWEYVWHCHILSHEEMDMMHTLSFATAPKATSNIAATYNYSQRRVTITWTNNAVNATHFKVQRASNAAGPWITLRTVAANTLTYVDTTTLRNRTYYYRVLANNLVGDTEVYPTSVNGYPKISIDSEPPAAGVSVVTSATVTTGTPVIFANGFDLGLAGWAGTVGNVVASPLAAIGQVAGEMGLIATPGTPGVVVQSLNDLPAQAAYVYDDTPDQEVAYRGKFFFNPMGSISGDGPVEIFVGLTQEDQPIFGVQYMHEEEASPYQLCAWVLQNGERVYTEKAVVTNSWSLIDLAWQSGLGAGFSLVVNEKHVGTLNGDTSAYKLDQILLGPSMGLSASTAGQMYFDDFTSNTIDAVVPAPWYKVFIPRINR